METLRLEKTSQIIKSNYYPNPSFRQLCLNKGEHWNNKNPWVIKPQNTKEPNKSVELK